MRVCCASAGEADNRNIGISSTAESLFTKDMVIALRAGSNAQTLAAHARSTLRLKTMLADGASRAIEDAVVDQSLEPLCCCGQSVALQRVTGLDERHHADALAGQLSDCVGHRRAIGGSGGSPKPVGRAVLAMKCASIASGASRIRIIR